MDFGYILTQGRGIHMITSIYYYNYYRPRILKSDSTQVRQLPIKKLITSSQEKNYNLSTAYKDNVISYARNLSESINSTKTSTNETITLIDDFIVDDDREKQGLKKKNDSKNVTSLGKSFKKLADALNKTLNFEKSSSQSEEYNQFAKNIANIAGNSYALSDLGFNYNDGELSFNEEKFNTLNIEEATDYVKEAYKDLKDIYKNTGEFMSKPLSNHMSFKSFSYYYSYSTGIVKNDSFNLISTGTLLNLQL